MDRVDRALEIHRGARDLVGTIVRTLEPDHGTASGRLPNPGAGKQANPRVIELRRFAERLDDLRLSDVAHYYYQVEKYAAAAVGVLGEMPGRQTGQALRFESLLLDLRTNAAAAEDAWAAWRDFQLAGVPGPAAAPVRPKSGAPLS
jgi:hypothetical protein